MSIQASKSSVVAPGIDRENSQTSLLAGQSAVVTGAVGSLGASIAASFASHGANVVIADVNKSAVDARAAEIRNTYGVKTLGVAFDVTNREATKNVVEQAESEVGTIDIIVANAGVLSTTPALDLSSQEWERTLSVNLTGAFNTATEFARRLVALEQGGSVIFTSSLFGVRGGRGNSAYSASKFGIVGLAQCMAAELASNGIRVNSVCPGQVDSDMLRGLFESRALENESDPAHEARVFEEKIPMQRLGLPDEIARTYVYLASNLSSYVTGQSLVVDGGWQVG